MTIQAAVGGTGVLAAVGVASDPGSNLASTGLNHTVLLVAISIVLILMGLLMTGLARRHRGFDVPVVPTYHGPPKQDT